MWISNIGDAKHVLQEDTGCALLASVGGEIKIVAYGSIVNPQGTVIHNRQKDHNNSSVLIILVEEGFEHLDPPFQPRDGDGDMKLEECKNWVVEWPKGANLGATTPHALVGASGPRNGQCIKSPFGSSTWNWQHIRSTSFGS